MFVLAATVRCLCASALSSNVCIHNFVVAQVLIVEQEIIICTQVKIARAHFGDYLGLPWAPGHEQVHRLFAEGGIHLIHCSRNP